MFHVRQSAIRNYRELVDPTADEAAAHDAIAAAAAIAHPIAGRPPRADQLALWRAGKRFGVRWSRLQLVIDAQKNVWTVRPASEAQLRAVKRHQREAVPIEQDLFAIASAAMLAAASENRRHPEARLVGVRREPPGRPIERRAPIGSWAALLSAAREEAGISRAKLAELVGTKPGAVTRWESGDVEIGESVVRRYATALGRCVVLKLPPAGEKP